MDYLDIKATKSSPQVRFDPQAQVMEIVGESYPEDAFKFYGPILQWLEAYLENGLNQEVDLTMEILYFNSSTSKVFMDMFDMLDKAAGEGKSVTVNWRCHEENEVARECGEEFMEDLERVRFNVVEFSGD